MLDNYESVTKDAIEFIKIMENKETNESFKTQVTEVINQIIEKHNKLYYYVLEVDKFIKIVQENENKLSNEVEDLIKLIKRDTRKNKEATGINTSESSIVNKILREHYANDK